jgi:hypothetical protein
MIDRPDFSKMFDERGNPLKPDDDDAPYGRDEYGNAYITEAIANFWKNRQSVEGSNEDGQQ